MTLAEHVIKTLKHESVAEHVTMNFLIDGSSRLELQEHMRHRIASTTCESTRFTLQLILDSLEDRDYLEQLELNAMNFNERFFVRPPALDLHQWDLDGNDAIYNYLAFIDDLNIQYDGFISFYQKWKKLGVKNDFIKYGLPEGYRTRFVWSINLRSLNNFLTLRTDKNAHFEIRHVANLIKETLKNTYIERLLS